MARIPISFTAALLSLQTGVVLSWPTSAHDTYQPEWSPISDGSWNQLGTSLAGAGASNSLYDPYPSGTRSYQVLEMVPGSPSIPTLPANGGFESGSSRTASNWTVRTAAGGPVYAIRTNF